VEEMSDVAVLPWHLFGQIFNCPDGTCLVLKTSQFNVNTMGANNDIVAKTALPSTDHVYQATATGEWKWMDDCLRRKFVTELSTEVWLEDDLFPSFSRADLAEWQRSCGECLN
jgi:hypothetical protein